MAKKTITVGFIILVLLTSSVYLILDDKVKIDIQETRSFFYVKDNGVWTQTGIEYVNLFDGTKKMRAKSRELITENTGNSIIITRTANYKDNISTIEIYTFDGSLNDVTQFPISHSIQVINGQGKLLQYEVQELEYSGETIKDIFSPQSFGKQMKVEWADGNYYSRIYKYKDRDVGKLTIKYRIDSADYSKEVRLFDPPNKTKNNKKEYNETEKKSTIKDENETIIGIAELKTGQSVNLFDMGDVKQLIAEISIDNKEDYKDLFNGIELIDLNTGEPLDREVRLMLKTKNYEEVPTYIESCLPKNCNILSNGTNGCYESCSVIQNGTTIRESDTWIDFDKSLGLKKGNFTIGIFIDIFPGDRGEWIITIYNVRHPEWATWTSNFDMSNNHYFRFDESAGANVEDIVNSSGNGTRAGTISDADWVAGKINNAVKLGGTNQKVTMPRLWSISEDFTMSFWFKNNVLISGSKSVIAQGTTVPNGYNLMWDSWNSNLLCMQSAPSFFQWCNRNTTVSADGWHHYVWIYKSSNDVNQMYVDGEQAWMSLTTGGPTFGAITLNFTRVLNDATFDFAIGVESDGNNGFWNGTIDELSVWNRTLNSTEVFDLYNSGNGIAPPEPPEFLAPNVTIQSPVDNYNATRGELIDFNCSASDDKLIENVSLYFDGILNYTVFDGVTNLTNLNISYSFPEGNYNWTCNAYDNDSQIGWAVNQSFTFPPDNPPNTTLVSPADLFTGGPTTAINFNCTASDDYAIDNLSFYLNGVLNYTVIGASNYTELNNSLTLIEGNYNWTCLSVDDANQKDWATNRSLTVTLNYDDFNLTISPGTTFNFYATSFYSNVSADGQNDSVGVLTANNNQSQIIDVVARVNETNNGIILHMGNNSNYSQGIAITTNWTEIFPNLGIGDTEYIWAWAEFQNATSRWFPSLEIMGRW